MHQILVSKEFRDFVKEVYPGLGDDPKMWGIMQICLFHRIIEEKGHVVPQDLVYAAVKNKSHKHSALSYLQEFEETTGIDLQIQPYRYGDGEARSINPLIDEELLLSLEEESRIPTAEKEDKVFFASGEHVSKKRLREENIAQIAFLKTLDEMTSDHPAFELKEYLNGQTASMYDKLFEHSLPIVRERILTSKDYDDAKKLQLLNQVAAIEQHPFPVYGKSERTTRLWVRGSNIVQLPKELRKLALSGNDVYEYDLAASQFSIASRLWPMPKTCDFLVSNGKLWQELADFCQVAVETAKPLLKSTSYCLIYGMNESRLFERIAYGGDTNEQGLGEAAALRYLNHWIVEEALEARDRQLKRIKDDGYGTDAFGRTIQLAWKRYDDGRCMPNTPSVLAQEAQSYELDIMLSLFNLIKSERQIRCLLWLHDGVTLRLANSTKVDRWRRKIQQTVNRYCEERGFPTYLEETSLMLPGEEDKQAAA